MRVSEFTFCQQIKQQKTDIASAKSQQHHHFQKASATEHLNGVLAFITHVYLPSQKKGIICHIRQAASKTCHSLPRGNGTMHRAAKL